MMGIIMAGMVVTGSERQGRPKSVQPGNREWITVIQAIRLLQRAKMDGQITSWVLSG